ncbi:MAG TPA: hypothetical protein VMB52_04375 [Verrucomicrobiae bacterium]|nr:hypothetical protein [Verrucomicrobiae bacterium]
MHRGSFADSTELSDPSRTVPTSALGPTPAPHTEEVAVPESIQQTAY